MKTKRINILAVTTDATPITANRETWKEAVEEVIEWADNENNEPIIEVFFRDVLDKDHTVEKWTVENLRKDLAEGKIDN